MQRAGGNRFDILLNNDIDFKSQISTGQSLIPITKYCLKILKHIINNNNFVLKCINKLIFTLKEIL